MKIIQPSFEIQSPATRDEGVGMLVRIERLARISHRSEDRQGPDSWRRFIQFVVMEKGDWSVVEHCSATVIARCDRGITHEWVRHRIGSYTQECVAGDTRLTSTLTIKDAYERNLIGRYIRSSDGKHLVKNKISCVFYKGVQPVFSVITKNGYRIKATLAHDFQISGGEFRRLQYLRVGDSVMVNGRSCLLRIDDNVLKTMFFERQLSPEEIAVETGAPYASVTRRLRKLGVFRDCRNDKDKQKYNKNHTVESTEKMRASILERYRTGRRVWNKGLKEKDSLSVERQGRALRANHYNNSCGPKNSNWKGGVAATARREAQRQKSDVTKCEVCGSCKRLEVHHIDENPLNNQLSNLVKLCHRCHKGVHGKFCLGIETIPDEIVSILYAGYEPVYDLEMKTHRNYVANGFVVHNSTRFVNYVKKGGIECVLPSGFDPGVDGEGISDKDYAFKAWKRSLEDAETEYYEMLERKESPQIARSVLPNALASTLAVTYNLRSWRHFFMMRTTRETHPDFRRITIPLLAAMKERIPILFDDIEPELKQSEALSKPR